MSEKPAAGGELSSTVRRNDSERLIRVLQSYSSIAESSCVYPGFRFSPTDTELVWYYLRKKLQGDVDGVDIIAEVDLYRHEPWDLPGLSVIPSEKEWLFFTTRGRKCPSGSHSHSKRGTESGYWKATGKERNVKYGGVTIGKKRTLVFQRARPPKRERTEWVMHEYYLCGTSQEAMVVCRLNRKFQLRPNEPSYHPRIWWSAGEADHESESVSRQQLVQESAGVGSSTPLKV